MADRHTVKNIGRRRIVLGGEVLFPGDVRHNVPTYQVKEAGWMHTNALEVDGKLYPERIVIQPLPVPEAAEPKEIDHERQPEQPDKPAAKRGSRKK